MLAHTQTPGNHDPYVMPPSIFNSQAARRGGRRNLQSAFYIDMKEQSSTVEHIKTHKKGNQIVGKSIRAFSTNQSP